MTDRARAPERHGVLVVDKPAGPSSAAVVARVRRALGVKRIGHTGTLDPMATGVLPLVLGEATKIAGYLLADDKAYDGALELGVATDSHDTTGRVQRRAPFVDVDEAACRAAMARLQGGEILQVPPMHAALRKDGQRLYELAHRGEEVPRDARPVRVDAFELTRWAPPAVEFTVRCGSGTYVRALVRDLGDALGCGAAMSALRRTQVGPFNLAQAIPLAELEAGRVPELVPAAAALGHLPRWVLGQAEVDRVRLGQRLPVPPELPSGLICLVDQAGSLVAVGATEVLAAEPGEHAIPARRLVFHRVMTQG